MARDDPTEPIFVDARPERSLRRASPRPAPKRVATRRAVAPRKAAADGRAERTTSLPRTDVPGEPGEPGGPPGERPADVPGEAAAGPGAPTRPARGQPGPRRAAGPRRRRPPPFMRPGAPGAIVMTGVLAVIVAFVATFAWAIVDASKPIAEPESEAPPDTAFVPPPTVDQTNTTRPTEDLTDDEIAQRVAATVRPVNTRDSAGQPVTGTAFVVGSFGGQTLLLTSFELVRASTRNPGPGITLDGNRQATLWTWEEGRDLALLVTGGSIESLPWATVEPKPGDKVWAGGAGQRMTPGVVVAVTDAGIEHNIFVDDVRRGSPLVNERGELLGMVSLAYNPGGRGTDTLYTAVPVRAACERVLRCGTGNTDPEAPATTTSTRP